MEREPYAEAKQATVDTLTRKLGRTNAPLKPAQAEAARLRAGIEAPTTAGDELRDAADEEFEQRGGDGSRIIAAMEAWSAAKQETE